ncbi:hypothetical protein BDA99DRAFT_522093 [Phascolomyces articulosus]|uniref:DUF202 domain-containing protein n=1 Tax=Phascolomyces articulosus TaxID=60185 RepID=A0AAD5K280_9FUNG|nr:hypothetical protein BDA99DRAFT_522093 [Phascolomyces articulosus]
METNAPSRFTLCNNENCCKKFNYIDVATVHSKVEGPDPRDHCANERNMLTWLRTGMILSLIGFMTLLDLPTQVFAPAQSIPWNHDPTSIQVEVVSFIFVGLGIASICVGIMIYWKNMNQILNRQIVVGHGWSGYTMVLLIVLFVLFVMAAALTT